MEVRYEKTIEVNNQLKVNVDEQQNDIKNNVIKMIKTKFRKYQVQEPPMKKNKSVCVTCNKNL